MDRNRIGKDAEKRAKKHLTRHKLKPITDNYHCRYGEIDLIMLDRSTLVFIEVRLRSHQQFGGAAASVTIPKQQKIIAAASHFLSHKPKYSNHTCRFDVITFQHNTAEEETVWYKDAFRS